MTYQERLDAIRVLHEKKIFKVINEKAKLKTIEYHCDFVKRFNALYDWIKELASVYDIDVIEFYDTSRRDSTDSSESFIEVIPTKEKFISCLMSTQFFDIRVREDGKDYLLCTVEWYERTIYIYSRNGKAIYEKCENAILKAILKDFEQDLEKISCHKTE